MYSSILTKNGVSVMKLSLKKLLHHPQMTILEKDDFHMK